MAYEAVHDEIWNAIIDNYQALLQRIYNMQLANQATLDGMSAQVQVLKATIDVNLNNSMQLVNQAIANAQANYVKINAQENTSIRVVGTSIQAYVNGNWVQIYPALYTS